MDEKAKIFLKLMVIIVSSTDCNGIGVDRPNNKNAGIKCVVNTNGRIKSAHPTKTKIVVIHLTIIIK
jgi:hypothetical protein